jgi:hypothetical protein
MISDADPGNVSRERCQARPKAARPDYREDMLCASCACTVVSFRGAAIPVCRIHEKKYARWGATAEEQAMLLWDWDPSGPVAAFAAGSVLALPALLTDTF